VHTAGADAPRTAWQRFQALGRRWPWAYRTAHRLAIALLLVELATGALLYFPATHDALMRWLPLILSLHVWCGVGWVVLLLLPLVRPLARRLGPVLDWGLVAWVLSGLLFTGLALWVGFDTVAALRSGAFTLHGLLALALTLWAVYHAAVRWAVAARWGAPPRGPRVPLTRRALLAYAGRGLASNALLTLGMGVFGDAAANAMARAVAPPRSAPGGSPPLAGFQLYTVTGSFPTYDPSTYRLVVDGLVEQPLSLTLTDLLERLPQVEEIRNFRCVTGWEVPDVRWGGVRIADILRLARPRPGADWLTFYSFDGVYTDSLSIAQATAPGVLLAHHADGLPLARAQGAPLRLVVPQMYGYKSVKWLARIEVASSRVLGYWEQRGYGPDAYLGTIDGWPPGQRPSFPW
jgi:DMSO/TMAO reductase YedYZ molybdopterin-dependent catalytic subunit